MKDDTANVYTGAVRPERIDGYVTALRCIADFDLASIKLLAADELRVQAEAYEILSAATDGGAR